MIETDARHGFASEQEAVDFLARHPDVSLFELFIVDANGVPRGKLLHREELLEVYRAGRPLPSAILNLTLNGEDVEESGLVWDVGDVDCRAYPLCGSLVLLPWRRRMPTGALQVQMHPQEGLPAGVADPRQLLTRVIDAVADDGLHPVMACELEFYLLDAQGDGSGRPRPALDVDGGRPDQVQVYGLRELEQIEPFLAEVYAACRLQDIPVRTAISEYAPGQVEITLQHGPALLAMDQAVRYKRLVKGVAQSHGMRACFMAKPFAHYAGSGMHMHLSLADRSGANRFASESREGTALLRYAIGGMLACLLDSLLFFCPNANSFRRFQARSYAPLAPTWGIDNRTVGLRVPGGPPNSRHVEHRICGADANPYLAAAAMIAASHRGVREQLDPGPPMEGNGYDKAETRLPTDWLSALTALEGSRWAREVFGDEFLRVYLAVKWAEYRQFMSEVGPQDWRWYLHQA